MQQNNGKRVRIFAPSVYPDASANSEVEEFFIDEERSSTSLPQMVLEPAAKALSRTSAFNPTQIPIFQSESRYAIPKYSFLYLAGQTGSANDLAAWNNWPGQIKVGPITGIQDRGVGFRKDSPQLREAFNRFFATINRDGTYLRLVQKYYPTVLDYYPDYFKRVSASQ